MSVTDLTPEAVDETPTPVAPQADAEKTTEEIFKWSAWVHVGDGAEECAERESGKCTVEAHFHAWVRLPNPFQVRDIIDKSKAAQARKLRELRDPASDASVILDGELEELAEGGDSAKAMVVDELVGAEYAEINQRAVREIDDEDDEAWEPSPDEEDDEKRPKLWGHIKQDQEELDRQRALPEDQQQGVAELESRVLAYLDAVQKRIEVIEEERRSFLAAKPMADLLKIVRRDRAESIATEVYLHTFNTWQWYVCTLKPRGKGTPNERVWGDVSKMKYEAPSEVILALRRTFDELESAMRSRRVGKGF
jgi:hypothetical protein